MSEKKLSERLHSAVINEVGYGMAFEQLQLETQALLKEVESLEAENQGLKEEFERLDDEYLKTVRKLRAASELPERVKKSSSEFALERKEVK